MIRNVRLQPEERNRARRGRPNVRKRYSISRFYEAGLIQGIFIKTMKAARGGNAQTESGTEGKHSGREQENKSEGRAERRG